MNNSIDISTITIQDLFEDFNIQKIDFLKIDCEGCEYETLFNTRNEYFQKIKKIAMEIHYHPKYKFQHMIEFLRNIGYDVNPRYLDDQNHSKNITISTMIYAKR